MSKKVLFVATVAKKHILQFHIPYLKWFKDHGYTVHVCAGDDFEPGEKAVIPYCDKFYKIPFYRSIFAKQNFTSYKKVKEIAKQNGYDIVHCHTPIAAFLARYALRKYHKKGMKMLYTAHGFHFYKGAPKVSSLYYLAEKIAAKHTDAMITINSEDYASAEKLCRKNNCTPYLIPGIGAKLDEVRDSKVTRADINKMFGIPEGKFLVMSNSEINENKNVELSIRAAAAADDVYLLICGTGSKLEYCKELTAQLGAADRIKFAGYRYDARTFLKACDAFIFPSFREGLGLAAIEAMAAGLPVMLAKNRGTVEFAKDGENSLLFDANDVEDFKNAMITLKNDPELRKKLGENAKATAEMYDLPNAMAAMDKIYSEFDKQVDK